MKQMSLIDYACVLAIRQIIQAREYYDLSSIKATYFHLHLTYFCLPSFDDNDSVFVYYIFGFLLSRG